MNYLGVLGTGLTYAVNFIASSSPPSSSINIPETEEKKLNLEGLTSALRIAMFPFAPNAQVKVETYAFDFDFPEVTLGINATAVKRTIKNLTWGEGSGVGKNNLVKVKRVARLILGLFPPIPAEVNKPKADITKIYEFFIEGLEYLKKEYFSEKSLKIMDKIREIPDVATFDYDPAIDGDLSEEKAARAIQETINLLKDCLRHKLEPMGNLNSIQQRIKGVYTPSLIAQFANGLELLKERQGTVPIHERWNCQHAFLSLNVLIEGCLAEFRQIRSDVSTMEPLRKEKTDLSKVEVPNNPNNSPMQQPLKEENTDSSKVEPPNNPNKSSVEQSLGVGKQKTKQGKTSGSASSSSNG